MHCGCTPPHVARPVPGPWCATKTVSPAKQTNTHESIPTSSTMVHDVPAVAAGSAPTEGADTVIAKAVMIKIGVSLLRFMVCSCGAAPPAFIRVLNMVMLAIAVARGETNSKTADRRLLSQRRRRKGAGQQPRTFAAGRRFRRHRGLTTFQASSRLDGGGWSSSPRVAS